MKSLHPLMNAGLGFIAACVLACGMAFCTAEQYHQLSHRQPAAQANLDSAYIISNGQQAIYMQESRVGCDHIKDAARAMMLGVKHGDFTVGCWVKKDARTFVLYWPQLNTKQEITPDPTEYVKPAGGVIGVTRPKATERG